jgi:hypothetical protein
MSDRLRVYVSDAVVTDQVVRTDRQRSLADPTPLAANEVKLSGPDDAPERLPGDYVTPGVAMHYWKWTGSGIAEMDQTDKDAVDAAEAAAADAAKTEEANITDWSGATKAFALVVLDEINLLRSNAGLAERTLAQLKAAIKAKL